MKREVKYTEGGSMGQWSISCQDCPLKPHLEALKMPAKDCLAGIQTNMQGHVPLATCQHYTKESFKGQKDGKNVIFTIECNKD